MSQQLADTIEVYWKKRQGGIEISSIRNELRETGKFSDDEIRQICRTISDRELNDATDGRAKRGVFVYWLFTIVWFITLITVLFLNESTLKLNEGMYWLFVSGSLILMLKNLYGLYRRYSEKGA